MTRELGEILAAIAARHQAGYARVEDPVSDAASLAAVVRRRRIVRHGTTTIVGAAATAALAFGVVQGWDAVRVPPAFSPTQPTTSEPTEGTPTQGTSSGSPTSSSPATSGVAFPALDKWRETGADPNVFGTATISDVVTVGGRIVAVGCMPDLAPTVGFPVWVSDDGVTWLRATGPKVPKEASEICLNGVVASPHGLYAYGSNLLRSQDGLTWEVVPSTSTIAFAGGYVDAMFVFGDRVTAVLQHWSSGEVPTSGRMVSTTDGETWADGPGDSSDYFTNSNADLNDVIATDGGLLAVGASPGGPSAPTAAAWASPDGQNWRKVTPDGEGFTGATMTAVARTGDGFIAVGGNPVGPGLMAVWSSTDGVTWKRAPAPAEQIDPKIDPKVSSLRADAVTWLGGTSYAIGLDDNMSRTNVEGPIPAIWKGPDAAPWERLAENAQPGPIPFSVTEFDGALFGFWPPLGWIGDGTVHVLTTAP